MSEVHAAAWAVQERIEWLLLTLNICGPMHMTDLWRTAGYTKGECEPVVRNSPVFVRDGINNGLWSAARVSKHYGEDERREFGEPRIKESSK